MFLSRNKKNNVYPCKPKFYYIKWGLRGSKLYRHVFMMLLKYKSHFEFALDQIVMCKAVVGIMTSVNCVIL